MKKSLVFVVALGFFGANLALPASAAIKAGTKCTSIGQVKASGSKQFICVKSGKKLLWKAQASVPTAPTSFKDLEVNSNGIPYSAWSSVQANIKAFPAAKTKVTSIFGPSTPKRYATDITEKMVLLGSRAMGNIVQPSEIKFYNFNKADVSWAKEAATQFVSPFRLGESLPQQAEKLCAGEDCNGAISNYVSGIGVVLVGVSTPVTRYGDLTRFNGQNDLHEYVHAVQGIIFANKRPNPPPTLIPCWYSEGQPQAVSILTSAATMKDYLNLRKDWFSKNMRWPMSDTSAGTIEKFLADNMKVPCPEATNLANYTVGFAVMETLISIGGIDKSFDLLKKVADGGSFESAFESEYLISWAEAAPIVARIVSKAVTEARK